jgi:ABC-type branched-subunit amino acid transport system ATPase component
MPILELRDVRVRYGAIEAVRGISLSAEQGQIVTLIGGNGAGKTTTLKTISGLMHPVGGEILFKGEPIHGRTAHEIVRLGICQSPEGRHIFPRMSVKENLEMGAYGRNAVGRRLRPRVHPLPGAEGTARAGRWHAVGWRAADAGDRARAHGTPDVAAAG